MPALQDARREAHALRAWVRLLRLPPGDPRLAEVRRWLSPTDGELARLLAGPEPPEGWAAVAERLRAVRMSLAGATADTAQAEVRRLRDEAVRLRALLAGLSGPYATTARDTLTLATTLLDEAIGSQPGDPRWAVAVHGAQRALGDAAAMAERARSMWGDVGREIAGALRRAVVSAAQAAAAAGTAVAAGAAEGVSATLPRWVLPAAAVVGVLWLTRR